MRTATVLALASLTAFACGGDPSEEPDDAAFRPDSRRPAPARVDSVSGSRPPPGEDGGTGDPYLSDADAFDPAITGRGGPSDARAGEMAAAEPEARAEEVAPPGPDTRAEEVVASGPDTRAEAVAAPEPEPPAGGRRYTVQVAAFTDADAARAWTERLTAQDIPAWTSMAELRGQTYHRVRVGVVPTVEEARQLGSFIARRYDWPVWVAPVSPADPVPADAVSATRRLIRGG
jgi:cell division septation protein DedD